MAFPVASIFPGLTAVLPLGMQEPKNLYVVEPKRRRPSIRIACFCANTASLQISLSPMKPSEFVSTALTTRMAFHLPNHPPLAWMASRSSSMHASDVDVDVKFLQPFLKLFHGYFNYTMAISDSVRALT